MANKFSEIAKNFNSYIKMKIDSKKENIDSEVRYNKAKARKMEAEADIMISLSKGAKAFVISGVIFVVLICIKTICYSDLNKIEINKNTIKVHFVKTK